MPKIGRKLLVLALAPLVVGVGGGVAWAAATDNMYPTRSYDASCRVDPDGGDGSVSCRTDNADVYYYMDSGGEYELEPTDRSMVSDTLASEYSPTDLAIHYDSTPVFSGSGETDIIYQEGSTNMPSSANGATWCNAVGGDSVYDCDQQYIRIRGGHYNKGLVCHETGHAIGLVHGSQANPALSQTDGRLGCMQSPVDIYESLGSNNIDNINATF
ncbi:hypothetical protein [Micromonospora foliorum]|uniref:hypothetical protein n=1 Tax=Micromonospora foliorum TaxID=2911210 RepID=UPI001EE9A7B2|nr:hypothetical protein [Micromonospora foliorum]MCG5435158.1 hypothetical protein [Micromonospora foliorum]